jgi:hypothetical protein
MKNPIVYLLLGAGAVVAILIAVIVGIGVGRASKTPPVPATPPVPVSITYRRSLVGNGYVFRITDTGSQELFCTATVRNSTVWKQYRLDLRPTQIKEIGQLQGWEAFPNDSCEVEADNFTPVTGAIPAQP